MCTFFTKDLDKYDDFQLKSVFKSIYERNIAIPYSYVYMQRCKYLDSIKKIVISLVKSYSDISKANHFRPKRVIQMACN